MNSFAWRCSCVAVVLLQLCCCSCAVTRQVTDVSLGITHTLSLYIYIYRVHEAWVLHTVVDDCSERSLHTHQPTKIDRSAGDAMMAGETILSVNSTFGCSNVVSRLNHS